MFSWIKWSVCLLYWWNTRKSARKMNVFIFGWNLCLIEAKWPPHRLGTDQNETRTRYWAVGLEAICLLGLTSIELFKFIEEIRPIFTLESLTSELFHLLYYHTLYFHLLYYFIKIKRKYIICKKNKLSDEHEKDHRDKPRY